MSGATSHTAQDAGEGAGPSPGANAPANVWANARVLKGLSLLCLGLVGVSLLLVHGDSYDPAVSYVPLYLLVSVTFATAVALILLPAAQFGGGFCAAAYALYAALFAAAAFFTGGVSSELYALFFPLLLAPALHGSLSVGLFGQGAALVAYALAMLPDVLNDLEGEDGAALVFFRLAIFALVGAFALAVGRRLAVPEPGGDGYALDEDGSMLLEEVSRELGGGGSGLRRARGRQVSAVLVDPGRDLSGEDVDVLLDRVRARISQPFLLGQGTVFGIVLAGADERRAESAARRALAAAGSLGARGTRAGVATYPRDASSAGDLLAAAGRALEVAYEIESPGAISFPPSADAPEDPRDSSHRAAR